MCWCGSVERASVESLLVWECASVLVWSVLVWECASVRVWSVLVWGVC